MSRRTLLGGIGAVAAASAASAILPSIAGVGEARASAAAMPASGLTPVQRRKRAYDVRVAAAYANLQLPIVGHPSNKDEVEYASTRIANFSKGMPHNSFGEVDPNAYDGFLLAVQSENPDDFESMIHGCPNVSQRMKFDNPQSGIAYDLEGLDSHQFTQPPAPRFHSAWEAGEIVENYWMALLRDVPYTDYATHPLALAACADLSSMLDFRGPKVGGQVTPETLFRDNTAGARIGPYLSQFFWRSQPYGAQYIEPRMRTTLPSIDYMTNSADWLDVQNGIQPLLANQFDPILRYMRDGRDLGQWVHVDVLYQAYFQAMIALLTPPDPSNPFTGGGIGCPVNPGNPYLSSLNQRGFGTFGGPYVATLLTEVSTRALKAVWYQKWFVHRRLRPEAFAGAVHHKLVNGRPYNIHADVLNSAALQQVYSRFGTYFLPIAFPEGSPIHPSYGAGHATVAGACVTILKALFDQNHPISSPMVPTSDGLALVPYTGADAGQMTVGTELDKLATNVAYGRNTAGVHWRTDGTESLKLGEALAISVLRDQRATYNEHFDGFVFTKFDGTSVQI